MATSPVSVTSIIQCYRKRWKELVLTDIAYKVIAFIILTPLMGVVFRLLLAGSGRSVVADEDMLHFFLGPIGLICFIVVGAVWLAIVALEQAALMCVLASSGSARVSVTGAIRFAAARGKSVMLVAMRVVALSLLVAAPFLGVAGLVYLTLLTDHDINFYLAEKPPKFWGAAACGVVLGLALTIVLLRLWSAWLLSLPLVLFEGTSPGSALRLSHDRSMGRRCTFAKWIAGWAVASSALASALSLTVVFIGRMTIPFARESLPFLVLMVGIFLGAWASPFKVIFSCL